MVLCDWSFLETILIMVATHYKRKRGQNSTLELYQQWILPEEDTIEITSLQRTRLMAGPNVSLLRRVPLTMVTDLIS